LSTFSYRECQFVSRLSSRITMTSLTGPSSTAALQPQTEQQPQQQPNPLESAAATEEAIFPTSTSTEDGPMVWVVQGKTDHAAYILKDTSTKKLIRWVWNNKTEWIDGSTEIKTELPKRRGRQHKPNHSQDFVYENDDHSAEVAVAKKPSSGSKKKAAKKYPVGTRVYKVCKKRKEIFRSFFLCFCSVWITW